MRMDQTPAEIYEHNGTHGCLVALLGSLTLTALVIGTFIGTCWILVRGVTSILGVK